MSGVLTVTLRALRRERWSLAQQLETAQELSKPCPPGHWRWADISTSGYEHKSDDELQKMYEANAAKIPGLTEELRIATQIIEALSKAQPE